MRPEIGHTIDPVKDVLRVGFPSESNTLAAHDTHVCALARYLVPGARAPISPPSPIFTIFSLARALCNCSSES